MNADNPKGLTQKTQSATSEVDEELASGNLQQAQILAEKLVKMTPTNDELLKIAKKFPPPPEWFEEDQEKPF